MSSAANIITPDLSQQLVVEPNQHRVADQLNLKPTESTNPVYKYRYIQAVNTGPTVALSTAVTQTIFNIPGDLVCNFAKSYVSFDLQLPSVNTAGAKNTVFTDSLPIDTLTLQTSTGQIIANLQDVNAYTKTARFMTTNLDEFKSRPSCYLGTSGTFAAPGTYNAAIGAGFESINFGCQPAKTSIAYQAATRTDAGTVTKLLTVGQASGANAAQLTNGAIVNSYIHDIYANANTYEVSDHQGYASITSNAATVLEANTAGAADGFVFTAAAGPAEPAIQIYWQSIPNPTSVSGSADENDSVQRLTSGGGTTTLGLGVVRYRVDLSAFVGTVLAMDKDMYFNQNMQLFIYWKPLNNWGFTSQADSTTNIASFASGTLANYGLWLANDVNNITSNAIRDQVNSGGVKLFIPYTNCTKYNMQAGAGQTFTTSLALTPGMGIACKRILTVPAVQNGVNALTMNTDNVAGGKWNSVQSNLNGKPIQDKALSVSAGEVFNYMYEMIKNSPSCISSRNFNISPFWCDNFSDCLESCEFPYHDHEESGMKVEQSMQYNMQWQIDAAYLKALTFYQYVTWVRRLEISPTGITIG